MKILALDTSSQAASCAWMEDGLLMGEFFLNASLTHSQTIMPMVQSMLDSLSLCVADADAFAVSCGPGSFTGLRIGIAAVKGMSMVFGKPCVSVSTLEALAWNLSTHRGVIVPVMDARREQVYTALFQGDGDSVMRVSEDFALSFEELANLTERMDDIMLVGDGAMLCRDFFSSVGRDIPVASPTLLHQRAGSVGLAAIGIAQKGGLTNAAALSPSYLRRPQAERERMEREKNGKDGAN